MQAGPKTLGRDDRRVPGEEHSASRHLQARDALQIFLVLEGGKVADAQV